MSTAGDENAAVEEISFNIRPWRSADVASVRDLVVCVQRQRMPHFNNY